MYIGHFSFPGIPSQPDHTQQASGLLPPMAVQNLAALAAMTQPSMQAAAPQQPSQQLTNALLCKSLVFRSKYFPFSFFNFPF